MYFVCFYSNHHEDIGDMGLECKLVCWISAVCTYAVPGSLTVSFAVVMPAIFLFFSSLCSVSFVAVTL